MSLELSRLEIEHKLYKLELEKEHKLQVNDLEFNYTFQKIELEKELQKLELKKNNNSIDFREGYSWNCLTRIWGMLKEYEKAFNKLANSNLLKNQNGIDIERRLRTLETKYLFRVLSKYDIYYLGLVRGILRWASSNPFLILYLISLYLFLTS